MGQDDENEGNAVDACLEHQWQFEQAVLTTPTAMGLRGLNLVESCKWCGALRYEPSSLEGNVRPRPAL